MFWMKHKLQKEYGCSREEHKNSMVAGCEVCSASVVKEDGEEMTSLRQKLQDLVVLENLDQENSGTDKMIKESTKMDDKLVLPEAIRESSEEFSNKKCIICFFGRHENHSYLKAKEAIFLCEDCKYRIACFYTLHVQEWHELLSPRSERRLISLVAEKTERAPSCVSSCRTGRRRRRKRRGRRRREKTGRNSYQQVLVRRYEDGDPTVGPLGQPSGKFDYLVRYSTVEPERNSFNASHEYLYSPTGWGDSE